MSICGSTSPSGRGRSGLLLTNRQADCWMMTDDPFTITNPRLPRVTMATTASGGFPLRGDKGVVKPRVFGGAQTPLMLSATALVAAECFFCWLARPDEPPTAAGNRKSVVQRSIVPLRSKPEPPRYGHTPLASHSTNVWIERFLTSVVNVLIELTPKFPRRVALTVFPVPPPRSKVITTA
jgi:hypothetical protein